MAPNRRRGSQRTAAAAARRQWNVGDLVLAKMKGFPAWPAVVTEPEKWGYSSSGRKKLLVYFYGTKQIAFCNFADIEAFTEEKKKSLLIKRQGKGSDFVRAVEEIIDIYETTKKQSLVETNSRDDGMESNSASSEGSRSKSLRKSREISSRVTNSNQSEDFYVTTESHDVIADETPVVSVDRQNTSAISSDPSEKVSILDQLRQTSLSATTTRKRLRDGSMQNSVIQRVPSLQRSRSSSGGDSCKLQNSTMTLSNVDMSSKDLVRDLVEEEPADKNKLAEVVAHVSKCCNGVTDASDGLTINGCIRDCVSDIAAVKSEKEGAVEISCKLENPIGQYLNENLGLNGGGRLNGKLDPPTKAVIVKKRRGSHTKRVTTTRESDAPDKAAVSIELHECRSESPTSHKETTEKFSKTDGDEHLPLVKRARVRMGKPSVEEKQLEDFVGDREKMEIEATVVNLDKCPTSPSPVNGSTGSRTARVKEVTSSVPTNGCTLSEEVDPVHWKVNKYQLKGITVDVEAALPPSKRLHRALEAMSANAAEATVDIAEAAGGIELASNGCTEHPKSNSLHLLAAENILSSARSPCIQSCDKTNLQNNASGLPSCLTSDNQEVSMLTSSLVEQDALPKSLSSPRDKDCKEMLADGRDCSGSITSEIAKADIHEKVLQPCTFKLIEKEMNSTSTEGFYCQLSSPLGGEDGNKTLKPAKEPSFPRGDIVGENGMVDPLMQKSDSILNSKEDGDSLPTDETAVASFGGNIGPVASRSFESTKSPGSVSDESIQSKDMQDVVKQFKHKAAMKYWEISSDIAPMKDLIAAAQAKRLFSRSTSFPDSFADGKVGLEDAVSPSVVNKEDSSIRGSPPNTRMYHRPASDVRTHQLHNGNRSPSVGQRQKSLNKLAVHGEANVARRSFEALLCTLSRTKESIGRATRVAIDCAKYGIAAEAIEILLQHLERESSMHKKIDLFFLVDSITQWSGSQKGGAGDVYLSLVQSILPRLLSAAAPPGHGAWENRKQCLKVLRLWLERKTLPDSVVRHNIRELESVSEASLSISYSRRPPRTERALNDPLREMEGMFVDEYGSNTNIQLQHFLNPHVLEDEEESGDDDKSFEAVTPERDNEIDGDKEITQNLAEKHRHILEDVDGELEMEDVAPKCGVEVTSLSHNAGANAVSSNHSQLEQHELLPCAPPLPEELPPSPPPLPSSPPPKPPHCSNTHTYVPQKQVTGSHAHSDVTDFHCSSITNNFHSQQHSVCQQSNNLQGNMVSSEPVPYYTHEYGSFPSQMPPPLLSQGSSGSYGSHPAMHSGNNVQPAINAPLSNKAYCLQPPPATVSNQFSYVQAESQQRAEPWCSSSYSDRYQYGHDSQGGNLLGDRSSMGSNQHESSERGRFSPAVNTGSVLPAKAETPSNSHPLYGPPTESLNPCHGWSIPHRSSSYYVSSSQPPLENQTSRVTGAHGYWRPR